MMATVTPPLPAVCRSHNAYPSRLVAQRMADLHPIFCPRGCPKCDEGRPFRPFRCDEDPSHFHVGHGFAISEIEEVAVTTLPTVPSVPTLPVRRVTKLSADQCREMVRLYHVEHLNPRVIAARFDVVPQTVHEVAKGRTYLWATREVLAALQIVVPPSTTKHKPQQAVQEVAVETQISQTPLDAVGRPVPLVGPASPNPLIGDMADALELLLLYRDRPLPRFVSVSGIRELVAQARAGSN
jgi:hypothetical protein